MDKLIAICQLDCFQYFCEAIFLWLLGLVLMFLLGEGLQKGLEKHFNIYQNGFEPPRFLLSDILKRKGQPFIKYENINKIYIFKYSKNPQFPYEIRIRINERCYVIDWNLVDDNSMYKFLNVLKIKVPKENIFYR